MRRKKSDKIGKKDKVARAIVPGSASASIPSGTALVQQMQLMADGPMAHLLLAEVNKLLRRIYDNLKDADALITQTGAIITAVDGVETKVDGSEQVTRYTVALQQYRTTLDLLLGFIAAQKKIVPTHQFFCSYCYYQIAQCNKFLAQQAHQQKSAQDFSRYHSAYYEAKTRAYELGYPEALADTANFMYRKGQPEAAAVIAQKAQAELEDFVESQEQKFNVRVVRSAENAVGASAAAGAIVPTDARAASRVSNKTIKVAIPTSISFAMKLIMSDKTLQATSARWRNKLQAMMFIQGSYLYLANQVEEHSAPDLRKILMQQHGLGMLKKLAEQGHPQACAMYVYSLIGQDPESIEALQLMQLCIQSNQGDAYPVGIAGMLAAYYDPDKPEFGPREKLLPANRPRYYKQAFDWLMETATRGLGMGMNDVGDQYEHGKGIPIDKVLARDWYRRAIKAGYEGAKTNLVRLYQANPELILAEDNVREMTLQAALNLHPVLEAPQAGSYFAWLGLETLKSNISATHHDEAQCKVLLSIGWRKYQSDQCLFNLACINSYSWLPGFEEKRSMHLFGLIAKDSTYYCFSQYMIARHYRKKEKKEVNVDRKALYKQRAQTAWSEYQATKDRPTNAEISHLGMITNIELLQEIQRLQSLPQSVIEKNYEALDTVLADATDKEAKTDGLLSLDTLQFNPEQTALLFFNLGNAFTKQTGLWSRKIQRLITTINQKLTQASLLVFMCDSRQLTMIIDGISKLWLDIKANPEVANTLHIYFNRCCEFEILEKFTLKELSILLLSLSRTNVGLPNLQFYMSEIMSVITQKLKQIADPDELTWSFLCNCLYACILLEKDCQQTRILRNEFWMFGVTLIKRVNEKATTPALQDLNNIDITQLYMVEKYIAKLSNDSNLKFIVPLRTRILTDFIKASKDKTVTTRVAQIEETPQFEVAPGLVSDNIFSLLNQDGTDFEEREEFVSLDSSQLHLAIYQFLRVYFPGIANEKPVNGFPVDMVIEEYKIQVDGPTHYLHGGDKPVQTHKTRVNTMLIGSQKVDVSTAEETQEDEDEEIVSKPVEAKADETSDKIEYKDVIRVPYYEWEHLVTDQQRYDYLQALFAKHSLTMPPIHVKHQVAAVLPVATAAAMAAAGFVASIGEVKEIAASDALADATLAATTPARIEHSPKTGPTYASVAAGDPQQLPAVAAGYPPQPPAVSRRPVS